MRIDVFRFSFLAGRLLSDPVLNLKTRDLSEIHFRTERYNARKATENRVRRHGVVVPAIRVYFELVYYRVNGRTKTR